MKKKQKIIASNPESDISIKYNSKNPIIKGLMDNYSKSLYSLLSEIVDIQNILEIGAGEGYWTEKLAIKFPNTKISSSDISNLEHEIRKENLSNIKNIDVIKADATKLKFKDESYDFVICLEVLEHIPNWQKAMEEISRVNKGYALFSVPNEPIWSFLNLLRGKYISRLGNTPDHVNKWSPTSFTKMLKDYGYRIRYIRTPLPWTMILVEK